MIKGYLDGSRDLRYDAVAVLMAERCTKSRLLGRCEGSLRSCRFETCPFDCEDPTDPNTWVNALYRSESGVWEMLIERRSKKAKAERQDAEEKDKPKPKPEKLTIGGWFKKWLT